MCFNFSLILCAFITFPPFSHMGQTGLSSLVCITTTLQQCRASPVSAQFMNPGPLCTRRLVWCSVCGALPENEFSLKHMPPADSFPFLIWNSNSYNERTNFLHWEEVAVGGAKVFTLSYPKWAESAFGRHKCKTDLDEGLVIVEGLGWGGLSTCR